MVAAGFEDAAGVENYTAVLNDHGSQGWELVGVAGFPAKSVAGWVAVLFLKRPVAA